MTRNVQVRGNRARYASYGVRAALYTPTGGGLLDRLTVTGNDFRAFTSLRGADGTGVLVSSNETTPIEMLIVTNNVMTGVAAEFKRGTWIIRRVKHVHIENNVYDGVNDEIYYQFKDSDVLTGRENRIGWPGKPDWGVWSPGDRVDYLLPVNGFTHAICATGGSPGTWTEH